MFSSIFSVFSAFLLVLSHLVNAAPVQPSQYLAIAPTITLPCNGTQWVAGSTQNVSWLTNNIPDQAQSYTLTILLGYLENGSENLDTHDPLATQVPVMQGTVAVQVPANATYRTNYVVAVIGSSGDISPTFTIIPSSNTSVALH